MGLMMGYLLYIPILWLIFWPSCMAVEGIVAVCGNKNRFNLGKVKIPSGFDLTKSNLNSVRWDLGIAGDLKTEMKKTKENDGIVVVIEGKKYPDMSSASRIRLFIRHSRESPDVALVSVSTHDTPEYVTRSFHLNDRPDLNPKSKDMFLNLSIYSGRKIYGTKAIYAPSSRQLVFFSRVPSNTFRPDSIKLDELNAKVPSERAVLGLKKLKSVCTRCFDDMVNAVIEDQSRGIVATAINGSSPAPQTYSLVVQQWFSYHLYEDLSRSVTQQGNIHPFTGNQLQDVYFIDKDYLEGTSF